MRAFLARIPVDVRVWCVLMALLASTVSASFFRLGAWNATLALGIAGVKALIVAGLYMRLWQSSPLIRLVVLAGIGWCGLLLALALADFSSPPG